MKLEIGTYITQRYDGKIQSIKKVTRVTEKRAYIKISDTAEMCFLIEASETGYVDEYAAQKWSRTSFNITTEQDRAELKHALAVQKLKNTEWGKLPEETVFKILELLKSNI